jgi:4,5-dihydroxyphthalate decarboxylase
MSEHEYAVVSKGHAILDPLAMGDVSVEGFNITVDRDTEGAVGRTLRDPDVMIGESSISRQVARVAAGDKTWVGIPFFVMRAFRHRTFLVRSGDTKSSFQDLVGGRIGTDNWMASGNTWSRAAIREQGLGLNQFQWVCGPVEAGDEQRPQGIMPTNASMAPEGRVLSDMLLKGDLDALMIPDPPKGFYDPESPYRRLFVDFRAVETAYYQRTRMWPGLHITVVRREVFEKHPKILGALFDAMEASRIEWMSKRLFLAETPWMLEELESSAALFGENLGLNGFEAIKANVDYFCGESYAQGLIERRVTAEEAFSEFLEYAPGR